MVADVVNDFELAAELVREAGDLAAMMRRDGVAIETKTSISDVVTAADRAAEELVVARLRIARPEDGLVGEEGTSVAAGDGGRTWFIDPVDGTYNFTRGLPMWCSAVALADAGGERQGAIYHPAADELWLGGRDRPTTCNGVAVRVDDRRLADVSVASYMHPSTLPDDRVRIPLLRAITAAATVRMIGSGSLELAAVAAGRLGCFVQHDSLPWDWYPGAALVAAAGGVTEVFERDGVRWHVAGGAAAVAEARALLLA
jgi:fructose-1,6-bisphosphatase/inositol monophosphatase family enzyme